MRKRKKRALHHRIIHKIKNNRGFATILLLLVVLALGILLSGALTTKQAPVTSGNMGSQYTCCDSGDGADCHPQTGSGQTFTYNGEEYGLLKSNVTFEEGTSHLRDSGQKAPDGNPIILNSSDGYKFPPQNAILECGQPGEDQIFNGAPPADFFTPTNPQLSNKYCTPIKNDELVYTCTKNCHDSACPGPIVPGIEGLTCYGDLDSTYNVYFRLSDLNDPGIPDAVKNCVKPDVTPIASQPTIVVTPEESKKNLQLQTFYVTQNFGSVPFLSPYCKPAVYLYPQTLSMVNVKVNSALPLNYTDPIYPATTGWNVLADPTGILNYQNNIYDYLYYETKVNDTTVKKPDTGYVVANGELKSLFKTLLPKLGLNAKESKQFSEYWLKALPTSPYYFVGIVPKSVLDSTATLDINPTPSEIIRVTLYFDPIQNKIDVPAPTIITPTRTGFTVVEWGGIFKKHKGTDFSCFM